MKTIGFVPKQLFRLLSYLIILCIMNQNCKSQAGNQTDFEKQREYMINTQIKSRGIKDKKVLEAMLKVERHKFVPEESKDLAYKDHPLSIGEGQTISQPYIVALMTEILKLDSTKNVLEVGTGSGYQAAVLGEICNKVYSIEIVKILGERAKTLLSKLGYKNINVKIGDGYKGWEEHAPFDAIIVTCAPTHIPEPLKEQLAEGGKMIIPVGGSFVQELVLLTKKNGKIIEKNVISVRFVPMVKDNGLVY